VRKLRGAAVVAASAAIAACYSLNLGSDPQAVALGQSMGSGLIDNGGLMYAYHFGVASGSVTAPFQFLPGPSPSDYYVTGVMTTTGCTQFPIFAASPPLDGTPGSAHVYNDPSGTCSTTGSGANNLRSTPQFGDCPNGFGVQFQPQTGSASCRFKFGYVLSDFVTTGTVILDVDGSGAVTGISASPQSLSFSTPTGQASGPQTASVHNMGSGSASGSAYTTDSHFTITPPTNWNLVGQGSSANYSVTCFSSVAGTFTGSAVFQPTSGSAAYVPLTCDVQDTAGLTFTGSPVSFPLTQVGSAAVPQTVMANYVGTSQPI